MEKMTIAGRELVVGLDWQPLPGLEKKATEIKLLASQVGNDYGVTRESGDSFQVGFCSKGFNGDASAAALLADHTDNILIVEKLGADNYWICLIKDGLIMPGGDTFGGLESIKLRFNEHMSMVLMDEDSSVRICANNIIDDFPEADDVGFGELTSGAKASSRERVRRVTGGLVSAPVVVLLLAMLSVAGYYGYDLIFAEEVLPIEVPVFQSKPKISTEELKERAYKEEVLLMNKALSKESPQEIVSTFMAYFEKVPTYNLGWKSVRYGYDPKNNRFKVRWVRDSTVATVGSFRKTFEESSISPALDGKSVIEIVPVGSIEREETVNSDALMEEGRGLHIELISDMQSASSDIKWTLGKVVQGPRKDGITGMKGADSLIAQLKYSEYEWTVSGGSLWFLPEIAKVLSKYKTNLGMSIIYTRETSGEGAWVLTGSAYEK